MISKPEDEIEVADSYAGVAIKWSVIFSILRKSEFASATKNNERHLLELI